jgi:hypothetical protein
VILTRFFSVFPCYEEPDDKSVQARLMANQTAFIDPRYRNRSFAESKLVEIIEQCWTFDPNERIDIFELVELLRNLVQENNAREAQALKMRNSLLTPHISVAPAR